MSDLELFMVGIGVVLTIVAGIVSVLFQAHRMVGLEAAEMRRTESQSLSDI